MAGEEVIDNQPENDDDNAVTAHIEEPKDVNADRGETGIDKLTREAAKYDDGESEGKDPAPPAEKEGSKSEDPEEPEGEVSGDGSGEQKGEEESYEPNFKYTVRGEEKEFPEVLRGVVKDKETEDRIRDILERADGLEPIKEQRSHIQNQFKEYKEQTDPIINQVKDAFTHLENGDFGNFLRVSGIDKNTVLQWAVQEAQKMDLPEDQRRAYDEREDARLKAYQLEQQNQQVQDQMHQLQVQQRQAELQSALSTSDAQSLKQVFDQRQANNPQARNLQQEIIWRGNAIWHTEGRDASPQEILEQLKLEYSPVIGQQQQAPGVSSAGAQAPAVETPPREKPVIPNVGGGGVQSPVKKRPTSIEDIEKKALQYSD